MKKTTYTTEGSIRGSCGHKHRTIETARKCLQEDQAGCRSQGGYSDRRIVEQTTRKMIYWEWMVFLNGNTEVKMFEVDQLAQAIEQGSTVHLRMMRWVDGPVYELFDYAVLSENRTIPNRTANGYKIPNRVKRIVSEVLR